MPSEISQTHPNEAQNTMGTTPPPPKTTEPLPCPRCNSTTTKFCYFNNYNLSQPRHFCKSCRRYWTQGGTLRDVPVGGGSRKNSRRSRSSSNNSSPSTSSSNSTTSNSATLTALTSIHEPESIPVALSSTTDYGVAAVKTDEMPAGINLNEGLAENGNFISLTAGSNDQHGFNGLVGYGYESGFGLGSCEAGLGFGARGFWSFPGMENVADNGGTIGGCTSGCNTWQLQGDHVEGGGGHGGFATDGENYFGSWPGLAISAPAEKGSD